MPRTGTSVLSTGNSSSQTSSRKPFTTQASALRLFSCILLTVTISAMVGCASLAPPSNRYDQSVRGGNYSGNNFVSHAWPKGDSLMEAEISFYTGQLGLTFDQALTLTSRHRLSLGKVHAYGSVSIGRYITLPNGKTIHLTVRSINKGRKYDLSYQTVSTIPTGAPVTKVSMVDGVATAEGWGLGGSYHASGGKRSSYYHVYKITGSGDTRKWTEKFSLTKHLPHQMPSLDNVESSITYTGTLKGLSKLAALAGPGQNETAMTGGNSTSTSKTEERLEALNKLKEKGIITEAEYQTKRAEILKDL